MYAFQNNVLHIYSYYTYFVQQNEQTKTKDTVADEVETDISRVDRH